MGVVLALLSALSWGSGDFVAGLASRRASSLAVVVSSQAIGAALLLTLAPLVDGRLDGASLAWGAAGGLASGVGLALLYFALALGPMTVVAPLTAVVAAVVPVGWGLAGGDVPSTVVLLGIVAALAAVVLVSLPVPEPAPVAPAAPGAPEGVGSGAPIGVPARPRIQPVAVAAALAAGVGFGVFFICFDRTAADAGLWPVVAARTATVLVLGALVLGRGRSPVVPSGTRAVVVLVGVLDSAAQAFYLFATHDAALPVVSVIASLYPAVTVVLAAFVLHEPMARRQLGALVVAAVGVVLIVLG